MNAEMIDIVVPQIGEAVSALRLVGWRKAVGEVVKKGDVLFEVDSDKAIVEVEAIADGTLSSILSPADSEIMPQQIVGKLEPANDIISNGRKVTPVARRIAEDMGINLQNVAGSGPRGRIVTNDVRRVAERNTIAADVRPAHNRVNASPKAKRLAREAGIDLRTLAAGTGVGGMVRAQDVEAVATASTDSTPAPAGVLPLSRLRQAVAARTQQSKQTVPHFYLMVDVNMTQANRLRDYCRSQPAWDKPPTYTALLIRACVLALADLPAANRSYGDGGLLVRQSVNIGVAVDTEQGLIVPVIPAADKLSLRDVSLALREASERARNGALRPSDLGEKSMSISNLGMYSVDTFIAIIDPPDPMILAVGRVADRFVPVNGQPVIQPMCTLTLSADHRVLDGAQGARFLEKVKDRLENPYELMRA